MKGTAINNDRNNILHNNVICNKIMDVFCLPYVPHKEEIYLTTIKSHTHFLEDPFNFTELEKVITWVKNTAPCLDGINLIKYLPSNVLVQLLNMYNYIWSENIINIPEIWKLISKQLLYQISKKTKWWKISISLTPCFIKIPNSMVKKRL